MPGGRRGIDGSTGSRLPPDSRAAMFTRYHAFLLGALAVVTLWSAVGPYDRTVWWLETVPAFLGLAILALTFRRYPLTPLVYALIALHMVILLVGGHFTYARVPLFDWIRDTLGLARNHFDRLGHFAQGFVPAMVAREILVRGRVVRTGGWLLFIVVSICVAISAAYEWVEWWVAVASRTGAEEFLATQGDPWDTQKDMFIAGIGALAAMLVMARWHDRQLAVLQSRLNEQGDRPAV